MSCNTKITIVGGGSYNWGPRLMCDLIQCREFENSDIMLFDINLKAAEEIKAALDRICKDNNKNFRFIATDNEEEAFKDADFVLITISTGGLNMMKHDLDIPDKYGIYQTVGDSVGPGGWSRLLRNVPIFVDMARKIEKLSPNAVILNYTNPMAGLTGAICETTDLKTVGLCHGMFGTRWYIGRILDVPMEEVSVRFGGINHFFWILDMAVKGRDAYKMLEEKLNGDSLVKYDKASDDPVGFSEKNHLLFADMYENYGCLNYVADRHTSEYFTGYLTDKNMMERFKLERTGVGTRQEKLDTRRQFALDLASGKEKMMEKSSETAIDIMKAMVTNTPFVDVVNLPNTGQIDNLPRGAVVETLGTVDGNGFTPTAIGKLPEVIRQVTEVHCHTQLMTLEAAMTGNKKLAMEALMLDPLCAKLPPSDVIKMGEELLTATAEYLPQFK
jgi:galacturan 1,4-alpha-galacturonidase